MVALRDAGAPLPSAALLLSPWLDLEATGDTMDANAATDATVRKDDTLYFASLYAKGDSARSPLASPLHADLGGLPPLAVFASRSERLFADAQRLADRARAAGVDVTLEARDATLHVWPFFAGIVPEGDEAIARIAELLAPHLRGDG
jgi:acetyl esterase/lipase